MTAASGTYRLAFHPTITKGDWYFGVTCHECGKSIHSIVNKNKSPVATTIVGNGQFSIPCYHCGHDDLYELDELTAQIAEENRKSLKGRRPSPSNSQKKPYLPAYKKYKVNIGPEAIELIPDIALVVSRIVSNWTLVETAISSFLSICLKADSEPSVALYLSLRNSRAKSDALDSVISLTLDKDDQHLFHAVMQWKGAVEKVRNEVAHGVLGASFETADHLFWMSTGDYAVHSISVRNDGLTDENKKSFQSRMFVYEIGTLERIAREIEELYHFLRAFGGYLTSSDPVWRKKRYPKLCAEPRIAKELSHIIKHPKNTDKDS